MRILRTIPFAITAGTLLACSAHDIVSSRASDTPPSRTAIDRYELHIASRTADDGALLFDVRGVVVDSVTAIRGVVFALDSVSDNMSAHPPSVRVVYRGALESGAIATLWLHDGEREGAGRPQVLLQEAAVGAALSNRSVQEFTITTTAR